MERGESTKVKRQTGNNIASHFIKLTHNSPKKMLSINTKRLGINSILGNDQNKRKKLSQNTLRRIKTNQNAVQSHLKINEEKSQTWTLFFCFNKNSANTGAKERDIVIKRARDIGKKHPASKSKNHDGNFTTQSKGNVYCNVGNKSILFSFSTSSSSSSCFFYFLWIRIAFRNVRNNFLFSSKGKLFNGTHNCFGVTVSIVYKCVCVWITLTISYLI